MTARTFRKRPIEIQAIQWTGENCDDVFAFLGYEHEPHEEPIAEVTIGTLEGDMAASPGDWIIKGIRGEFYPCKPEIFAATYEEVM